MIMIKVPVKAQPVYRINTSEPAYEMYKLNIDWSPSQHLGYDKLSLDSAKLAQAQQRASRAVVRAEQGNPSKYFSH